MNHDKLLHHRIFIYVEGQNGKHPSYSRGAKIFFTKNDILDYREENPFLISPIFSANTDGDYMPIYKQKRFSILFLYIPQPFPVFSQVFKQFGVSNFWFSEGLANLLYIGDDQDKLSSLIQFVKSTEGVCNAYELWDVNDELIVNYHTEVLNEEKFTIDETEPIIGDHELDLDIKFLITEYHLNKVDFLSKSKRYTKKYYINHLNLFKVLDKIVLEYITEVKDKDSSHINSEDLSNKLGRIVQLNSAFAYLQYQGYSGTIPILKNSAIIKRFSLLGIGSSIGALYELILELEGKLSNMQLEDISSSNYAKVNAIDDEKLIPDLFASLMIETRLTDFWISQSLKNKALLSKGNEDRIEDLQYNRLAYYSGRLGFKEYEFFATSAMQVLVSAATVKWSVINYTHEILHHHVRLIVNKLLHPFENTSTNFESWQNQILSNLYLFNKKKFSEVTRFSIYEYIQFSCFVYLSNIEYYGSLSFSSFKDPANIHTKFNDLRIPTKTELDTVIRDEYRNISEIIVHIFDFNYIYCSDIDIYIETIWTSWAEVPSVYEHIENYLLRSMVVYASIFQVGLPKNRFDDIKVKLKNNLNRVLGKDSSLMQKINISFDTNEFDLLKRFKNCLIIADITTNYLVSNIFLDMNSHFSQNENNEEIVIDFEFSDGFSQNELNSKLSFLMGYLLDSIKNKKHLDFSNEKIERESAFLLLSLSS